MLKAFLESAGGNVNDITLIADWSAAFATALGKTVDLNAAGLGVRSRRFSMLVENGIIKTVFDEPNPGELSIADGDTMFEACSL